MKTMSSATYPSLLDLPGDLWYEILGRCSIDTRAVLCHASRVTSEIVADSRRPVALSARVAAGMHRFHGQDTPFLQCVRTSPRQDVRRRPVWRWEGDLPEDTEELDWTFLMEFDGGIRRDAPIRPEVWEALWKSPMLQRIRLVEWTHGPSPPLPHHLPPMRQLEEVRFDGYAIPPRLPASPTPLFPALRTLHMTATLPEHAPWDWLVAAPSLETLSLLLVFERHEDPAFATEGVRLHEHLLSLAHLRCLFFEGMVPDAFFHALESAPSACTWRERIHFLRIRVVPRQQYPSLRGVDVPSGAGEAWTPLLPSKIEHIRLFVPYFSLSLSWHRWVTTNTRSLHVTGPTPVRLLTMTPSLSQLTSLSFHSNRCLQDRCVEMLARALPRLRKVSLRHCGHIHGGCLATLVRIHAPHLRSLEFTSSMPRIYDLETRAREFTEALAMCRQLHTLIVRGTLPMLHPDHLDPLPACLRNLGVGGTGVVFVDPTPYVQRWLAAASPLSRVLHVSSYRELATAGRIDPRLLEDRVVRMLDEELLLRVWPTTDHDPVGST